MVFSSLFFLYFFLPLCVICYAATKRIYYRNMVLLAFSLIFYAWGEPLCVFLLIISAAVNFLFGLVIDRYKGRTGSKIAVTSAVIFDVAVLGIFKYSGFIVENINAVAGLNLNVPDIKLPIGISFFTFQMISYIIDCYWEKVEVQKSYSKFLMYVSLFPQLVAGPIVRYSTIESEISSRKTTLDDLYSGISRIAVGLGKKVIIANSLSDVVTSLFDGELKNISVVGTWLGAALYALQIYFDFSGYSDIAIGLGRIFGFHFDENFNYPFICKDVSEFWQRWHISLSTFFRDYLLYVPIFGKRRKYGGLFLVWFCTGLWHGASWNFVLWGLYFGVILALEKIFLLKFLKKIPAFFSHLYSLLLIIFGWVIFECGSLGEIASYLKAMFSVGVPGWSGETTYVLANSALLLAVLAVCSTELCGKLGKRMKSGYWRCAGTAALLLLCVLFLAGDSYNPFLYFRF